MAAGDKPTTEMPFRAAQGVSRFFLLESLRTGCEDIEKQHEELQLARDKAEGLLVKEQPAEFDLLLQDILKSCVKGLQTHACIVEAVAETLSADVGESVEGGNNASGKYALLVGQIKYAAAGVDQLREINIRKEKSPTPPAESDFNSAPEVQSSKKSNARQSEEPTPRKKTKTKHASNTSASMKEAPSSDSADEKPMKGKGKKLSKPSKASKLAARTCLPTQVSNTDIPASKMSDATKEDAMFTPCSEPQDIEPKDPNTSTDIPPATPAAADRRNSFEDIDSEVNARLAAKELKRARKKELKKRKRDSLASEIFSPDPKATPEHAAPLPPKKKARVETTKSDSKGKRQNIDDVPGGKGKNKAKKQKTDGVKKEDVEVEPEPKPSKEHGMTNASAHSDGLGEAAKVKANKPKRRRSSAVVEASAPTATQDAAAETNIRKKRRVGF